jgi:hypothetical protein
MSARPGPRRGSRAITIPTPISSWRPDECSTATTLSYARAMFESAQSGLPPPAEGVRAARRAVLQVTGLSHESQSVGDKSLDYAH